MFIHWKTEHQSIAIGMNTYIRLERIPSLRLLGDCGDFQTHSHLKMSNDMSFIVHIIPSCTV